MRNSFEKLVRQEIPWIILISVILSFTFGVMSMQIDKDGNISTCPFMNESSLCKMNTFEHVSTFQVLFTSIPGKIISILLISIALLVLSLFTFARHWLKLFTEEAKIQRDYSTQIFYIPFLFNPIRRALSRGIIQPKICELVIL